MPKGRDLKSKLKHYSHNSPQQQHTHNRRTGDSSSTTSTDTSLVTERLAQLRIEQLRAEKNRQQRLLQQQQQQGILGQVLLGQNDQDEAITSCIPSSTTTPSRSTSSLSGSSHYYSPRVAGPAPPPSWTRRAVVRRPPAANRPFSETTTTSAAAASSSSSSSLREQCAYLATDIVLQQPSVVSTLSMATKQLVLNRLGLRLTDAILPYFRDEHYSQLFLHSAPISFSAFVRCFWRIEPLSPAEAIQGHDDDAMGEAKEDLAEDWEEQEERRDNLDGDVGDVVRYTYDPSLDWALEPIIQLLKQPVDQDHILTTPLSMKLITLDVSFIPLPACAAHLIAATLPQLTNLSVAGCFATDPGLANVLARRMKQLRRWDIGYHGWLDLTSIGTIDWKRDLLHLQWLGVAMCGRDFNGGQEMAESIHQHRRQQQLRITTTSSST
ncbi:hypothetical protein BDB00DRAFT_869054 [Zychaea mexicana]|uniref:uncharacterized protein n=1 Tax=Zychaea mexicana TaxID=64656 RepID=UPI0022FDEA8E|nr:uncharacterized protein BDB00DRAFT_869054 [Zychaea mexicana]KAI9496824.1 hypothetical protein BDB00DRAFT_869054 [Zychaea mexicana]